MIQLLARQRPALLELELARHLGVFELHAGRTCAGKPRSRLGKARTSGWDDVGAEMLDVCDPRHVGLVAAIRLCGDDATCA